MIGYSITKAVSIDASKDRVFEFLTDSANWPKWAIVNVKSVKGADDNWWDLKTPAGMAKLRIRPNAECDILDHDFNAPGANRTVPTRLVSNKSGCEFMITFIQTPAITRQFFEEQAALVDKERAQLKSLIMSA